MDTKSIITISRQYGSGGRFIGRKLANKLGIPFYDQELISLAAKESGFSEGFFKNAEKKATSSFLYSLYLHGTVEGNSGLPLDEQAFIIQSGVILDVAKKGPCVIVGRCADYVLKDFPNVTNIFIYSNLRDRIRRAITYYGVAPEKAESTIRNADKRRGTYNHYYSGRKWGEAANYHLCINSDAVGIDPAVEVIAAFVQAKDHPNHG